MTRPVFPLIALLMAASMGCAGFNLKENIPWGKATEDGPGRPSKLVAFWTQSIMHRADGLPIRGLAGRVMFYNEESVKPIKIKGAVSVFAFDEANVDINNTAPIRKYIFSMEDVEKHEAETPVGPCYDFWLPWDTIDGQQEDIGLVVRFAPEEGGVVLGELTKTKLSGTMPVAKRNPPETESGYAGQPALARFAARRSANVPPNFQQAQYVPAEQSYGGMEQASYDQAAGDQAAQGQAEYDQQGYADGTHDQGGYYQQGYGEPVNGQSEEYAPAHDSAGYYDPAYDPAAYQQSGHDPSGYDQNGYQPGYDAGYESGVEPASYEEQLPYSPPVRPRAGRQMQATTINLPPRFRFSAQPEQRIPEQAQAFEQAGPGAYSAMRGHGPNAASPRDWPSTLNGGAGDAPVHTAASGGAATGMSSQGPPESAARTLPSARFSPSTRRALGGPIFPPQREHVQLPPFQSGSPSDRSLPPQSGQAWRGSSSGRPGVPMWSNAAGQSPQVPAQAAP